MSITKQNLPNFLRLKSLSIFIIITMTCSLQYISLADTRKLKRPACNDRKDNDKDGLIDFPKDPGCKNRRDRKERNSPNQGSNDFLSNGDLLNIQIFPENNEWNKDISQSSIDPNSNNLIASIGNNKNLHPDFGTFWEGMPIGIPYMVLGASFPKQSITFYYDDESDPGPYPIPNNPDIEGGENSNGDRHVLIVDRDQKILYELYRVYKISDRWTADSGAIFNLNSNTLRPNGWTSADAAGLPILPGLVRYDEVMIKKEISHALRFTTSQTRKAYTHPATHYASNNTDVNLPPMGMRVRLKASFDISNFNEPTKVILIALKKYGMMLADNGSNWFISGTHDPRWNDDQLSDLKEVPGSAFEVITMDNITTAE